MRSYERDLARLGSEELGRRASPHGFAGDMLKLMQDKHKEVLDSAPNDDARQLAEYALRGRHERVFQGFLAQERRLGLRSDVEIHRCRRTSASPGWRRISRLMPHSPPAIS